VLLVDGRTDRPDETGDRLTADLEDQGGRVERTAAIVERLHAVEATYLAIFGALGTLGLALGALGLGLLVLRHVWERRSELALLQATGFTRRQILLLVGLEHLILFGLGLLGGVVATLVALPPRDGAGLPILLILGRALLVFAAGALATVAALPLAVRSSPADALRAE
jgi:ABC-type antimicrobial peptide transport system permease subunit